MAKKHSIQIDLIDKFAKEFIEKEGYNYSIEEHPNRTIVEKHIQIHKDKTKGKIVFYISGGQVSYQVQTGNQTIRTILEKCWLHIFENTKLPNIDAKSFSAKNIEAELFDCFIEDLRKQYNVIEKENTNTTIRNQYLISGEYGACLNLQ